MPKGLTRGLLCFAAGLVAGMVVLPALRRPPPGVVPTFVTDSPAEAALERPIDEFRFEGTRREAVAELARRAGVAIGADWEVLANRGWGADDRVRLDRRDAPLADLLSEIWRGELNPPYVTPVGPGVRLLPHGANRPAGRLVRAYDVRDLLTSDPPEAPPPGGGTGGLFGNAGPGRPRRFADDGADLCDLIRQSAVPGSWEDSGSRAGVVNYGGGRLVVWQTWAGHREVRRVLAEVRRPGTPTRGNAGDRIGYAWNPSVGGWVSADPASLDAALERPIGAFEAKDATLAEMVAAFAKQSGLPISVDDDALLARAGSFAEQRYAVACPPGPVADALDRILLEWPPALKLDYVFRGGTVVVTTAEAAADEAHLRLYDLTDWPPLVAEMRTVGEPGVQRNQASAVMEDLKRMVGQQVAPTREYRGPTGDVLTYYGVLLVRQTPRGHRAVRRFLADVRSLDGLRDAAATRPAR